MQGLARTLRKVSSAMRIGAENCFCAFCKRPRKVYLNKHIGLKHILLCSGLALAITVSIWGVWDPRALFFAVTFLGVAEFLTHLRWRLSMPCPQCGFDPVMYLRDPAQATQRVQIHLKNIEQSPTGFLRTPQLPMRRQKSPAAAKSTKGQNFSQRV